MDCGDAFGSADARTIASPQKEPSLDGFERESEVVILTKGQGVRRRLNAISAAVVLEWRGSV
jgi:hypothetical protein